MNSIRNKFKNLFNDIGDSFDVFSIAETKLDNSFPNAQFFTPGYKSPYRLDVSNTSGGIMVYVKKGLPSLLLTSFSIPNDVQIIPIEIRLKNMKWLIISIYRPPKQDLVYFLSNLSNLIDFYNFEKCLIIGDFNVEPSDVRLISFLNTQVLHNHVNFNTCFKSKEGRCIDLIMSNQKHGLHSTGCLNTGISDFHLLIYTMLKSTYTRIKPKNIVYRCFRNFSELNFQNELAIETRNFDRDISDYDVFETIFESVLDKHAPKKSKLVRGNEKPHMNKELKRAIMKRSQLWNKFQKTKCSSDLHAYRIQRNSVTRLNKLAKQELFNSAINLSKNKPKAFWNLCKPFFSNKGFVESEIIVKKDGEFIQDKSSLAESFNVHYNAITKSLNLFEWNKHYCSQIENPVERAIDKFKIHPSIVKIRNSVDGPKFEFKEVDCHQVRKLIMALDCTKKTGGSISNTLLKSSINIVDSIISDSINRSFSCSKFPDKLKLAEITPIPKKGDSLEIGDYRPISILPSVSKLFEKVMLKQLNSFFESKFSNFLCGFRKGHSTQHALFRLLASWQKSLDKGEIVGTVLMDLSKAYDCLPHDLLIAKLEAYGVGFKSLSLLSDYLSNRYHRVKIDSCKSGWMKLLSGVPQGSILGPILFNIFLNDMFLFISEAEIYNFADDNSLVANDASLLVVIKILIRETTRIIEWYKINSMAANPAKFQVMFLGRKEFNTIEFKVEDIVLKSTNSVKLLGVIIDCKLNFDQHIEKLCSTASQKVKA